MSGLPGVSVFTEFQPLKKVLLGKSYPPEYYEHFEDPEVRSGLQRIAQETEEDILRLVKVFEDFGTEVLRPEISAPLYLEEGEPKKIRRTRISNGRWMTNFPNAPLWPRDLTLAVGNKILSVYSRSKGRWIEGQSFYPVFKRLFEQNADWVSMPPPLLNDSAEDYAFYEGKELLFHAACFQKCGRDLFHTPPGGALAGGRGTDLGLQWIKRQLPGFRFHAVDRPGHLDGKLSILRPGLILSALPKELLPEAFQSWDVVQVEYRSPLPENFQHLRKSRFYSDFVNKWLTEWIGNVDETYFDVNVLSLDENTVILNSYNPDLMAKLERHGVKCIPFEFRHRFFWDGGLHCISLDLYREGALESYF